MIKDLRTFVLPKEILLEINYHCNYRCPWCYCIWHESPPDPMRNLPIESWKKIISYAKEQGVHSFLFTGGEATMYRGWQDLLRFTRSGFPKGGIALFTNGSRMNEDDLLLCKKLDVDICVSLPGLRTYDEMTGTRRSYRKVLELMMRAKEIRHPCAVSITVTRQNLFEIMDIYATACICGASVVQFNVLMLAGRALNRSDLVVSYREWLQLKEKVEHCPCNVPCRWSEETFCCCEHPTENIPIWNNMPNSTCHAGKSFGVFGPDGYYRRCLHTKKRLFFWRDFL